MHDQQEIKALSDTALITKLEALSVRENEATVDILLHLAEVERRELFLAAGHSSLFAYCTSAPLRYAETAALRRIAAARAVARFPELAVLLRSKELSLTTLALAAGVLTPDNVNAVIGMVKGKSRRAVEEYLAALRPQRPKPEQVRAVAVVVPAAAAAGSLFDHPASAAKEKSVTIFTAPGAGNAQNSLESQPAAQPAAPEPRYELRFSVNRATMRKLDEARLLLSGKFPRGAKLEDVLDEALELLLEKRSPKRREKRRVKRAAPRKAPLRLARSRHIPQALRDQVHVRDGQQCTFFGKDGVRCGCRHDLEVHHIKPWGRGGLHDLSNLKLLCRRHNAYEAAREYGQAAAKAFSRNQGGVATAAGPAASPPLV